MTNPIEQTETWKWVRNHFRRMGWRAELRKCVGPSGITLSEFAVVFVQEPKSTVQAFQTLPASDFERPAKQMAPWIVRNIMETLGAHWREQRGVHVAVKKCADINHVPIDVFVDSMLSAANHRASRVEQETEED